MKRVRAFGSDEVVFFKEEEEEEARRLSYKPRRTEEIDFIPLYMGRRIAKLWVHKVPKREGPVQVAAAILKPIIDRMEVVEVTVEEERFWQGKMVYLSIQVEPDAMPDVPESILIGMKSSTFLLRDAGRGVLSVAKLATFKK